MEWKNTVNLYSGLYLYQIGEMVFLSQSIFDGKYVIQNLASFNFRVN